MKRKFLSMFMALTMALTLIPTTAFAYTQDINKLPFGKFEVGTSDPDDVQADCGLTVDDLQTNFKPNEVGVSSEAGPDARLDPNNYAQVFHPTGTLKYAEAADGDYPSDDGYFSTVSVSGLEADDQITRSGTSELADPDEYATDGKISFTTQIYAHSDLGKLTYDEESGKVKFGLPGKDKLFGEDLYGPASYLIIERGGKKSSLLFIYDEVDVEAIPVVVEGEAYEASVKVIPGLEIAKNDTITISKKGDSKTHPAEADFANAVVMLGKTKLESPADYTYADTGVLTFAKAQTAHYGDVLTITPAAVPINAVTVADFVAPSFNAKPVTGGGTGVTCSTTGVKPLTADSVVWDGELSTDKTFKGGVPYKVTITLQAQDGYVFPTSPTVTAANLPTDPVTDSNPNGYKVSDDKKSLTITKTFDELANVTINKFELDAETYTIAMNSGTLNLGGKLTVKANPDETPNKAAAWTSSNKAVATVDPSSGVVTPVAPGTTTITVTSVIDPNWTDTCTVTVTKEPQSVTGSVEDSGSTPVPGITVNLWKVDDNGNLSETEYTTTTKDSSDAGEFEFTSVLPGSYKAITVQTDKYEATESAEFKVDAAAVNNVSITLSPRTYDATLRALDDSGAVTDKVTLSLVEDTTNAEVPITNGVAKLAVGGTYHLYDQNGDTGVTLTSNANGSGTITVTDGGTAVTASAPDATTKASTIEAQYYTVDCSVTAKDDTGADLPAAAVRIEATINSKPAWEITSDNNLVLAGSDITFTASVGAKNPTYTWGPASAGLTAGGTDTEVELTGLNGTKNITCTITATEAAENVAVTIDPQLDNSGTTWTGSGTPAQTDFYLMAGETKYEDLTEIPDGGTYDIYMSDGKGGGYDTLSDVTADGTTPGVVHFYTVEFKVSDSSAVTKGACIQATYHGTDTPSAANRSEGSVVVLKGQPVSFKIALPANSDDQTYSYLWKSSSTTLTTESTATIDKVMAPYTATNSSTNVVCTLTSKLKLTGASIEPAKVELKKAGDTKNLTLKILPADIVPGDVADYKWSSTDDSVVTVAGSNDTAVITAVKDGSATIKVTFKYNGEVYTETVPCQVTVGEVTGPTITLDQTTLTMTVGDEAVTLTPTVTGGTGSDKITWSSDAPTIAEVDSTGKVTAKAKGTANITATVTISGKDYTATCAVTVSEKQSITVAPPTMTLKVGAKGSLTATVPASATDKTVTWTFEDESIATVSTTGEVTAVAVGTAVIKASVDDTDVEDGICTVTVNETGEVSVTLNKTGLSLTVGDVDDTLKATGDTVTWSSSDTGVATVDPNTGKVTAIGAGTAKITATSKTDSSKSDTCTVTVQAKTPANPNPPTPPTPVITGVTVTPATLSLTVGTTGTLTATVQKDGEDDATEKVTWSSDDEAVATVDADGKVTAKAAGTATITATSVTDTSKSASCEVTVSAKPVEPAIETENIKGETKADLAEGVEDPDGKLLEAAKSVETDEKVLGDNASTNAVVQGELAAMDKEAEAQKLTEILKTEVTPAEVKPVTITYLDIKVEGYNPDKDALSLRMNITPKVKVVLTTQKVIDDVNAKKTSINTEAGEGQNAIELVKEETLTVNDYVAVSVTLPSAFMDAAAGKPIYARHYSHEYPCRDGKDGAITFTTWGFSPFEFTTDPQSKVWINQGKSDEMGYATLDDALAYVKDGDVIRVEDSTDKGNTDRTDLAGATITILDSDGNRWTGTLTINGDRQTIGNDGKVTVGGSVTPPTPSHSGGSSSGSGGGTGVWGGTGSSTPRVSVNSGNHGKITASTATPKKGDIVTLTITPDDGYELDTLSVKSGGEELDVDIDGNKATFEMPGTSVTVKATFRAVGSEPGTR